MPLLSQLLASIFSGLTGVIAAVFGAQVAARLAAVTALFTFAGALSVAFNAAVAPLVSVVLNNPFGQVAGLAFPPIAGTCLATIATTWAGCGLFSLQRRALGMLAG